MNRMCALYRCRSKDGSLLYAGVSITLLTRMASHETAQPWWHEVARIDVEMFPSEAAARDAERAAITAEMPRYNVQHNPMRPRRHRTDPRDTVIQQLVADCERLELEITCREYEIEMLIAAQIDLDTSR
jgi:predicted GIY-YIG superfamily endonuclease